MFQVINFDVIFCVSFLFLVHVTFCQLVIPSCFLFAITSACYLVIRKKRAKRISGEGKYVLITGCDSGFGNALARVLDTRGMYVFATCLSENSDGAKYLKEVGSKRLRVLEMDVSSDQSVSNCLMKVEDVCRNTGLLAVVNNAGILNTAAVELESMSNYKKLAEVNLFGMVRVCKTFLPLIRKCKGRAVNVTSANGLTTRLKRSAYHITKYGGEGFSDSLRLEMKRFGVKVILVEPGEYGLVTGLYNARNADRYEKSQKEVVDAASDEIRDTYGQEYLDKSLFVPKMLTNASDSDIGPVVEAMEDAVLSSQPRYRYLVDGISKFDRLCALARLNAVLPAFIMDRLKDALL